MITPWEIADEINFILYLELGLSSCYVEKAEDSDEYFLIDALSYEKALVNPEIFLTNLDSWIESAKLDGYEDTQWLEAKVWELVKA